MLKETIKEILLHLKDGSVLIKTDCRVYRLRMGGFLHLDEEINRSDYKSILPENCIERDVSVIYTDTEWVYILLDNNYLIASGWTSISPDGSPSIGIQFKHLSDYGDEFFDEDMYLISPDSLGDSQLVRGVP